MKLSSTRPVVTSTISCSEDNWLCARDQRGSIAGICRSHCPCPCAEINPDVVTSAMALLAGGLLMIGSRSRRCR